MSKYRRTYNPGGTFFFTVVTHNRKPLLTQNENITHLRNAFLHVKNKHPFIIDAIVILPDHMHTLWQLPKNDTDYSLRWRLIKHYVSCHTKKDKKQVWQRRFWEHTIKNTNDWRNHMDYIHYNPVKHGYADMPKSWPYSSFKKYITQGWYDENWGSTPPVSIRNFELE